MASQPSRPGSGAGHGLLSGGPLKPFSYPRFRLFWAASLSSVMPFVMGMAARGWLVLVLTDSPFMVTAVQGVLMLPMALLTPFGGVIADRLNRKMVLLASDAANLLIFLGLTLLLLLGLIQVWHVFALAFLNGMAFSMSTPTRATVIHDVVGQGDLAKGVAVYTTVFSISQLVGPALAGYLMGRSPDQLGWTFLAASAFLVPAMAFLIPLSIPNRAATLAGASRTSVMGSMGEGLGYVRANSLSGGVDAYERCVRGLRSPLPDRPAGIRTGHPGCRPRRTGDVAGGGRRGGHNRVFHRGPLQLHAADAGPHLLRRDSHSAQRSSCSLSHPISPRPWRWPWVWG